MPDPTKMLQGYNTLFLPMVVWDVINRHVLQCDRSRPECSKCTERGLECIYLDVAIETPISASQLQKLAYLNGDPSTILHLLTTLPYFDALELFNMLREMPQGREASVTSTEAGVTLSIPSSSPQPPQHNLIRSLLPTSNPLEQELMVEHPIVYPVLLPTALSGLPLEYLLTSRKPGMTATQFLCDTRSPSFADIMLMDEEELDEDNALLKFCKELPHLEQSHIDYLQKVDISLWMEMPIPNQTAVRVIAVYLNNDYPVLPVFHADLFLRDLSQNRPYFCSALLISALLGWVCVSKVPDNDSFALSTLTLFLLMSASKPALVSTQRLLHGALSFSLMLRLGGASSITMNPLQYLVFLHSSSCL